MSLQPLIQVSANHKNVWNNFKSVLFIVAFNSILVHIHLFHGLLCLSLVTSLVLIFVNLCNQIDCNLRHKNSSFFHCCLPSTKCTENFQSIFPDVIYLYPNQVLAKNSMTNYYVIDAGTSCEDKGDGRNSKEASTAPQQDSWGQYYSKQTFR